MSSPFELLEVDVAVLCGDEGALFEGVSDTGFLLLFEGVGTAFCGDLISIETNWLTYLEHGAPEVANLGGSCNVFTFLSSFRCFLERSRSTQLLVI